MPINHKQVALGAQNLADIRNLLVVYPGISRAEIAAKLALSQMAVSRHVATIRAEWGASMLPTRRGRAVLEKGQGS